MEPITLMILVMMYFVPAVVGFSRKHKSAQAIALVNIFLGWSVIGWLWALVWANTGNTDTTTETPDTHVKCPDCAELVKREAKVCKHCGCKLIPQ